MNTSGARRGHCDADVSIGSSLLDVALHDVLSDEEMHLIRQWIDDWFHLAVEQGRIDWPYVVNEAMVLTIQTCYRMKMSPEEAVYFCYRMQNESTLF
ncbi:MAG: hypothetical protein EPN57_26740 [Paraburkholderia sp.]|nr:MAG: hypothetical protein EPN57_26740 [Paraburkholderia sp.]